jgi:hypothetical protein
MKLLTVLSTFASKYINFARVASYSAGRMPRRPNSHRAWQENLRRDRNQNIEAEERPKKRKYRDQWHCSPWNSWYNLITLNPKLYNIFEIIHSSLSNFKVHIPSLRSICVYCQWVQHTNCEITQAKVHIFLIPLRSIVYKVILKIIWEPILQ